MLEANGKKVKLIKDEYRNGNLYLGLALRNGEPYADITTNAGKLGKGEFCVDTNNFPQAMAFLLENGIASPTGKGVDCGWCVYPVWKLEER